MDETPDVPKDASLPPDGDNPPSKPPRKMWKRICIILGLIMLAVLVFNPASLIILSIFIGSREIKMREKKLQQPAVYEPVARTLATYCQSDRQLFPALVSYACLPPEISRMVHPWCEVSSKMASVEMGGGFYHFGYRLTLDEAASVRATN